ncbi:bacillithiol biosynthesis cysteine-adding enzyme BshC [Flavobacteriaceae bacterium MAR_2010_188]|nr:bacillithiol biosynthesis cysteine-adding enzyme BshC [Flavobacteriaceae bacterium MAR_2010_188]
MPSDSIPFKETNYFSQIICDYLDEKPELNPFYNQFPRLENFKLQIEEKAKNYDQEFREVLVKSLHNQYRDVSTSDLTKSHIESLSNNNTYTIVTGHQLNLFTGPLYFFYKIISTINLCKILKLKYPTSNFVPIYWMATEDHDFEEINYFNFEGKKVQWNRDASGPVGHLKLLGLDEIFKVFSKHLNDSENSDKLKKLFTDAYLKNENLTDAMRFLVNELFKDEGLVIIDGDDKDLKTLFKPTMQKEIIENISFKKAEETIDEINKLGANYKVQVNPREINLFYIKENLRERIVELEGKFYVNDSDMSWDKAGIMQELDAHPERFSPNVIMRPVYQEQILPNLCYIGGGGELAYWLQLKSTFKAYDITFPFLLLRNSALILTETHLKKIDKLNVEVKDLFLKNSELRTLVTKRVSEISLDFSEQKQHLKNQFEDLYKLAEETDASFKGAVAAQQRKQIKGLENLEKRLLKAQKRKVSDYLERVTEIQNELFPSHSLQERNSNFSEFYMRYGEAFKLKLLQNLEPLKFEFLVLEI